MFEYLLASLESSYKEVITTYAHFKRPIVFQVLISVFVILYFFFCDH